MITHHEYPCLHTPDMTRTLVASIIAALFVCVAPSVGRAQPRPIQSSRWQWHVAVSGAMNTRTASHNEPISDGELSAVAVQGARPLYRWRGVTFSWLAEVLPVMRVTSGAPPQSVPNASVDPLEANDPVRRARYDLRRGVGFGVAPLGAEGSMPLSRRAQLLVNVTAGVAWFDQVVPYGKATQANFTVAPAVAVQHDVGSQDAFALGYALHHLSNASMGGANPGMNSHLLFVRWARKR
jgi:hypothetical protein